MDLDKTRELQQKFEDDHLRSFWDRVRFYFFMRRIYWTKKIVIWEGLLDKLYFETMFEKELKYNDDLDRKGLQEQNQKSAKDRDFIMIASIEERISRSKAIKESYRRNEDFLADNYKYLEMLELWDAGEKNGDVEENKTEV